MNTVKQPRARPFTSPDGVKRTERLVLYFTPGEFDAVLATAGVPKSKLAVHVRDNALRAATGLQ